MRMKFLLPLAILLLACGCQNTKQLDMSIAGASGDIKNHITDAEQDNQKLLPTLKGDQVPLSKDMTANHVGAIKASSAEDASVSALEKREAKFEDESKWYFSPFQHNIFWTTVIGLGIMFVLANAGGLLNKIGAPGYLGSIGTALFHISTLGLSALAKGIGALWAMIYKPKAVTTVTTTVTTPPPPAPMTTEIKPATLPPVIANAVASAAIEAAKP